MHRHKIDGIFWSLVIVSLLGVTITRVAAQPQRDVTVESCIRIGLENNRSLRILQARSFEALARHEQAQAQRLPAITGQGQYLRLSSNIPSIDVSFPSLPGLDTSTFSIAPVVYDQYRFQLNVEQPLFTGLRLHHTIKAAEYRAEAAESDLEQEEVNVAFQIRQAYWTLYEAREALQVAEEAIRQVEAHLVLVQNLFEAGAATEAEVLTAKARKSEALLDRVDAEDQVRMARLELNHLMGLPLDTDLRLTDSVHVEPAWGDLADLISTALENRPELVSLELQVRALDASVEATQGDRFPQVMFVGRYLYARPNPYFFTEQDVFKGTWEAGVFVSMDLWNWGESRAKTSEARALLQDAEAQREYLKDSVRLEVNRRYLALRRAVDALDVAGQGSEEAAAAFRATQNHFEQGAALSADVLDAEIALRTAELRRVRALTAYAIAQAGLLHVVGRVW